MNFNVNSISPSFRALYMVEGTGREVINYGDDIKTQYELSNSLPDCIEMDDYIKDFDLLYLTGLYGEEQSYAKLLVATNEDCDAISNWDDKYVKPYKVSDIVDPDKGINWGKLGELLQYASQKYEEHANAVAEYEYSLRDDNALLDFIAKNNTKASELLQQIKEFTSKTIQTFKFKDVMEAIKEGRFNIATGEMKPKIKP